MTEPTTTIGQHICQLCGATWQEYVHKCGDGGQALQPSPSSAAFPQDEKLERAYTYIDNALTGLSMRGEADSPLVRDLVAAQDLIREVQAFN